MKTQSLCPECLSRIDAEIVAYGKDYYLEKNCPVHGAFRTVVWRGGVPPEDWIINKERAFCAKPSGGMHKGCPFDCGICAEHRQHTCAALIELTQNCNLHCRFCFADANAGRSPDPTLTEIRRMYQNIFEMSGPCNIQLSGGEPTIRNDLPAIIKMGIDIGFPFIQINTNGIRLGEESFVKELKSAGLHSIFLQFDGTEDSIYRELRGEELFESKCKAIENCDRQGIGVVLVPTLIPGVNVDNIGEIIRFGLAHIDTVRGIHFQPVSYFGRTPRIPRDEDRITLPEVIAEIERQTDGKIKADTMKPPQCENSLCSFHGSYIFLGNDNLMSLGSRTSCCGTGTAAEGARKAKSYVVRNWSSRGLDGKEAPSMPGPGEAIGFDEILNSMRSNSFSISGMAFQDVWNVDLERVRDCCIHVATPEGKLIPFCAYNMTDREGRPLYR